ncbi:MAG: dTMP kinase [Chloroflexi bacterium]|nr:dTMP kinase [Chloroflexota bacterium]
MFLTLEGPDGSGKSSQMNPLAEYLREQGHDVLETREPGGTEIGDQVRQVIMDLKNKSMFPTSEILLFQAARAQLVREVIQPSLAEGKVVLCDRYADSTLAYQGYGHQTDLELLKRIIEFATGGLIPDLTFYLDIDAQEGLRRRTDGGGEWNRLDDYEVAFHQRVRAGYHEMIAAEPERWVEIDGAQSPEVVQKTLQDAVLARLKVQE